MCGSTDDGTSAGVSCSTGHRTAASVSCPTVYRTSATVIGRSVVVHTGVTSRCSTILLFIFARLTIAAQHHGAGGDQNESNLSGKSFVHWSFALIMVARQNRRATRALSAEEKADHTTTLGAVLTAPPKWNAVWPGFR